MNTEQISAMRLALEELELHHGSKPCGLCDDRNVACDTATAIIELKKSLEPFDKSPDIPKAFSEWWSSDYDDDTNPFMKDSFAYWAWAGWSAAMGQRQSDEPVGWSVVGDGDSGKFAIGERFEMNEPHIKTYWENRGYKLEPVYARPQKQVEQDEPVFWHYRSRLGNGYFTDKRAEPSIDWLETPLYTRPQKREWVGLSDEEIVNLALEKLGADNR